MEDLESIKEQVLDRIDYGTDVKLFSDIWEVLRDHVNIVRCKDCKHYHVHHFAFCDLDNRTQSEEWFCADGEMKGGS